MGLELLLEESRLKLLGNKDLRKGRITRQEVHCLGTWTWTRRWGELSEEVPRWAVGADLLVWQGASLFWAS